MIVTGSWHGEQFKKLFLNNITLISENVEKIFARLQQVNMDQNPFVVVSIIGQELLNAGHIQPAITCLENALKIGTVGLRMRGSVISALTSAYWKVGNLSRSV